MTQLQRYLSHVVAQCEQVLVRSVNTICELINVNYRIEPSYNKTDSKNAVFIVFAFELMLPGTIFTLIRLLLSYILVSAVLNLIEPGDKTLQAGGEVRTTNVASREK